MRRTRIFSIIVFLIAVVSFVVFQAWNYIFTDRSAPTISMDEAAITVSVDADEAALLAGISAEDETDGDITDSLMVESLSNFIAENTRRLTFAVSDSAGHVVKGYREIVYSDYHSPQFSLQKPLRFQTGVQNILDGVSAEDLLDGDLTSKIKISGDYTFTGDQAGDYPMEFTVANSAGDVVKLPVTVTVYTAEEELKRPQIELSDYLVYTSVGTQLNPWDYVQKITVGETSFTRAEDGRLRTPYGEEVLGWTSIAKSEVSITDPVDYNTPGTYEITYQFAFQEDRVGTVRLIVVVSD